MPSCNSCKDFIPEEELAVNMPLAISSCQKLLEINPATNYPSGGCQISIITYDNGYCLRLCPKND